MIWFQKKIIVFWEATTQSVVQLLLDLECDSAAELLFLLKNMKNRVMKISLKVRR